MKRAAALLALCCGLVAGEARAVIAIDSVTTSTSWSTTGTPVTITSIPSGAVVVMLGAGASTSTPTSTSANLVFTTRQWSHVQGGYAYIATAVAGAALTNEVITLTTTSTITGDNFPTVVVLTGANTGALATAIGNSGSSTASSFAVAGIGWASIHLGVFNGYTSASTGTPSAFATTVSSYSAATSSKSAWTVMPTVVGAGQLSMGGTWGSGQQWNAAGIEIQTTVPMPNGSVDGGVQFDAGAGLPAYAFPYTNSTQATTTAFSTSAAPALLIAMVEQGDPNLTASTSPMTLSGGGLTWTMISDSFDPGAATGTIPRIVMFSAVAASLLSNVKVTLTKPASYARTGVVVYAFDNASGVGATSTDRYLAGTYGPTPSSTLTATSASSLLLFGGVGYSSSATGYANPTSTFSPGFTPGFWSYGNVGNDYWTEYATSTGVGPRTLVWPGFQTSTNSAWAISGVEILAAPTESVTAPATASGYRRRGFRVVAADTAPVGASFVGTGSPPIQSIGYASNTATFTGVSIGTPAATRIVVVGVANDVATAPTASVSVNGTNLTSAVSAGRSSIWYGIVSSASTATVVVTCSPNTFALIGIQVGALTGVQTAPSATGTTAWGFLADPHSVTSTVPVGGIGVAMVLAENSTGVPAWTGAVGDSYSVTSTGNQTLAALAHTTSTGAVTMSMGGGFAYSGVDMSMATWGP